MAAKVVGSNGHDDEGRGIVEPVREERKEIERRPVRPLEILNDEHQRRLGGEALEDPEDQLEQPALSGRVELTGRRQVGAPRRQLGHEARDLGSRRPEERRQPSLLRRSNELAQHLDERSVGQRTGPEIQARALEHARAARPGSRFELVEESRLADARLAGNDDDAPTARGGHVQGAIEPGQLARPADERVTAAGPLHGARIIRAPWRDSEGAAEEKVLTDLRPGPAQERARGTVRAPDPLRDLGAAVAVGGEDHGLAVIALQPGDGRPYGRGLFRLDGVRLGRGHE